MREDVAAKMLGIFWLPVKELQMKHMLMMVLACLLLLPCIGGAEEEPYGYPIQGAYEATIIGTPGSQDFSRPEKTCYFLL